MKELATATKNMERSGIRVLMDLSAGLEDIIHLEVGEPDFSTPEHIVEAGAKAAKDGFTRYTPNPGLLTLRSLLVEKLAKYNNIKTSEENIIVTPGAVAGIASALMALVEPWDEVLVPNPCWPNYVMQLAILRAVPVSYPLLPENGFLPDFDRMHSLVKSKTKAIIVNSPSNPSGSVWSKENYESLMIFAKQHDLYILTDEVYEAIMFDGQHYSPASVDDDGRVISVFGFSKTYAMTGWRLGYVVASSEIASIIAKLQEPLVSCASAVSQKAAEAALTGPQDVVVKMRDEYCTRRDLCMDVVKEHGLYEYTPHGAFYMLINISSFHADSYEAAKTLLLDHKVATAPGKTFGKVTAPYIRISLATGREQLLLGVRRICDVLQSKSNV